MPNRCRKGRLLNNRNKQVAQDDCVGNALCGSPPQTEDTGQKTKNNTEHVLTSRGYRACHIIGCHEECTEDQTTSAYFTGYIIRIMIAEDEDEDCGCDDVGQRDAQGNYLANYQVSCTDQKSDDRNLTDGSRNLTDEHGC